MIPPRFRAAVLVLLPVLAASPVSAQDAHDHSNTRPQSVSSWQWSWDANVFIGWNYQDRKFTDFQELESQNWVMGAGERQLGKGRLRISTMLSLEPLTIQDLGSPQVFQTGETFEGTSLVDYQHPHDLFMRLSATYVRPAGRFNTFVEGSLVGEPSIGPTPFMHRPSAIENPTVPLSHHQLDATHITPGVVRGGIESRGIALEVSWFRGAEPDENRTDLDVGALDSWAARVTWRRGPWEAQASRGYLTAPEWVEPFADVIRLTASVAYTSFDGRLASLVAWGQNRETHGVLDAYLFETTAHLTGRDVAYTRAELVAKDILGSGSRHLPGFDHFHPLSRVGALTLGYLREVRVAREGRWGVGGDVTVHYVPPNLEFNYGSPASYHVFLRYRPARSPAHRH
jgi:hypothetical protein